MVRAVGGYRQQVRRLTPSMRQVHRAGEKRSVGSLGGRQEHGLFLGSPSDPRKSSTASGRRVKQGRPAAQAADRAIRLPTHQSSVAPGDTCQINHGTDLVLPTSWPSASHSDQARYDAGQYPNHHVSVGTRYVLWSNVRFFCPPT